MATVFIGLGSNLGDRYINLQNALDALAFFSQIEKVSPIYETEPVYILEQPRFLNCVCQMTCSLSPSDLLKALKTIEKDLGRMFSQRNGPRLIDLDILFYDDLILTQPDLIIPHPRLNERPFVLVPLADIAPTWIHPQVGLSVETLRAKLGDTRSQVWLASYPLTFSGP
jgi:2-amino-4-hydroxy-6-hydroxymethyldihydropteridine diphosphokinase